jgi:hypothetical protein
LWDRQYVASLGIFAAAAVFTMIGVASLLRWLGWVGAAGLLAIAGGFLVWFYWGPRPDLIPRGDGPKPDGPRND